MSYLVQMKETDGITDFADCFSAQDEIDIQNAQVDQLVNLNGCDALLDKHGVIDIITNNPTTQHHFLKYATLCSKLAKHEPCD